MNILAPFNDQNTLDMLLDAGARELYMGFYEADWVKCFGKYSDINRLTLFKERANQYTLADIPQIAWAVHVRGCKLYITINAPGYSQIQQSVLENYLLYLAQSGVDGVIVSVPQLVEPVINYGMQAVASTMCGIYHEDVARFYADLGVSRMILPRELNLDEIAAIMQAVSEVEYEVFLMRNGCRYADAYCMGLHGGDCGALCFSLRQGMMQAKISSNSNKGADEQQAFSQKLWESHRQFASQYHEFSCGQCAIWRMQQLGVSAVKIVGRLDDMREVTVDTAITNRNMQIALQCESEAEYLEKMELPGDLEGYCREGLSCYYPEVRWR